MLTSLKHLIALFLVFIPNILLSQLVRCEYFFDTDPGIGNGTDITNFALTFNLNQNFNISTTGLTTGNHFLYIRTLDASGIWSLSEPRSISTFPSIVTSEYFYDTDPGIGNGISLSGFSISDSINFTTTFVTTGLTSGSHNLYIRTKDSEGKWSLSEPRSFSLIPSLANAEYFYDTDPGIGNGIPINGITANDSINFNFEFSTSGLTSGNHTLYIRTKDSERKWSISEARSFTILPSIVASEYYYDTDPGIGNGISIPGIIPSDSVNNNVTPSTSGLTSGSHQLYIRTKDSEGKWSLSEPRSITILPSVLAAEYFLDTDPGIGSGFPVTNFSSSDSINTNISIPTSLLSEGNHILYIRILDSDRKWSLSEPRSISILPSIVSAEYFYDTDPGQGNGIEIVNVNFNTDSININYLFPTNSLAIGQHRLYIRTKDSKGLWSLAEPRTFNLQADSAIIVRAFIEGYYSGSRQMIAVLDPANQPIVCDPVTIGLASSVNPFTSIFEQPTFLMTDGTATISVPPSTSGNTLYIYIKGRNFVETWSKNPVLISGNTYFNFSSATGF